MLSQYTRHIACDIAELLATDGMVWGEELEWYIRKCFDDVGEIKSDEHYLEIENAILDIVSKKKRRIKVTDTKRNNKVTYFDNLDEVAKILKSTKPNLQQNIYKKKRFKTRYLIEYANANYKEI